MKELFAWLSCITVAIGGFWYLPQIIMRRVTPAPATWIVGTTAMWIAVFAYHSLPNRTVIENVALYAAAAEISAILITLITVLYWSGALKVHFDRLQWFCIVAMLVPLAYWILHREEGALKVTFWTTQTMLVVAYIATLGKLLQRKAAFDSLIHWGAVLLMSLFGAVPAFQEAFFGSGRLYGLGNSVRSVTSSAIIVSLFCLYDSRAGWSRIKDEVDTNAGLLRKLIGRRRG